MPAGRALGMMMHDPERPVLRACNLQYLSKAAVLRAATAAAVLPHRISREAGAPEHRLQVVQRGRDDSVFANCLELEREQALLVQRIIGACFSMQV